MEFIPENPILEFHPDTLQAVRKLYNLDQPGRSEKAIDIIDEWIKKQEHFIKKDFSRDYLERLIIANKGLLERVKMRLDRLCTLRTLLPHLFGSYNIKKTFEEFSVVSYVVLPKLTADNYRVLIIENKGKEFSSTFFLNYYRALIINWEYLQKHDYSTGLLIVMVDHTDVNPMEVIAKLDVTQLRHVISLFVEGYGTRIKGLHIISSSKVIDTLLAILKQVMSAKIVDRIHVHPNPEALHNFVPKDMLPADYGGKEKPMSEINDKFRNIVSSDEHIEYMKTMNAAKTDESRRTLDKFNEEYLGTPGTFRTMVVD